MKLSLLTLLVLVVRLNDSTTIINYNEYCPEGSVSLPEAIHTCISITSEPSQYNQEYLKLGSTAIDIYLKMIINPSFQMIDYMTNKQVISVWLPIKINADNLFAWDLAGPLKDNGLIQELNDQPEMIQYGDGNCAVYVVDFGYLIRLTTCNSSHHHLRFFDATEPLVAYSGLCDNEIIGRSPKFHDLCFKFENASQISGCDPYVIDSNDTFVVIAQIINKLNMTNDYILVNNKLSSVPDNSISVFHNGQITNVDKNSDYKRLVVEKRSIENTSITISFNTSSNELLAIVTNFEYLWSMNKSAALWCNIQIDIANTLYKELNYDHLLSEWGNAKVFRINLNTSYEGIETVWCEGQKLRTSEKIVSNRIFIKRELNPITNVVVCAKLPLTKCTDRPYPCSQFLNELKMIRNHSIDSQETPCNIKRVYIKKIENFQALLHFEVANTTTKPLLQVESCITNITEFKTCTDFRYDNVCQSIKSKSPFPDAKLNEKVLSNKLCYNDIATLASQECIGNIMDGAHWKSLVDNSTLRCPETDKYPENNELFDVIKRLENYAKEPPETLVQIIEKAMLLLNNITKTVINNIGMQLSSEALYRLAKITPANIFDLTASVTFDSITNLLDAVLNVQTDSLIGDKITLLDTIDLLTTKFSDSKTFESDANDDGVLMYQSSNVIFTIINPLVKNITGFELHRTSDEVQNFHDFTIAKLYNNHSIENTKLDTLELMAHIPTETYNQIMVRHNDTIVPANRIVYKIYYQEMLFNQTISDEDQIVANSKIIGIDIPNFPSNQLYPSGGIVYLHQKTTTAGAKGTFGCAENNIASKSTKFWEIFSKDTKKPDIKIIEVCGIKQSANIGFATLLGPSYVPEIISTLLSNTTNLGSMLSIIGLIIIFITAIFNPDWHKREATPLLLNVSVAAMFLIFVYYINEIYGTIEYAKYCSKVGGLQHFAVLVSFCVSVLVTNCQYRRYVIVLGASIPRQLKVKLLIFGWLLPFVIVFLCWVLTPESYSTILIIVNEDYLELNLICFPKEYVLFFCLHVPIIIIFIFNMTIYVWIIKRLMREDPNLRKDPRRSNVFVQIRLFVFLFSVLSITWIFGLLQYYTDISIFAFLFNLTAPLQGFCLCIFSVFIDLQTRKFWIKTCSSKFK